MKKIVGTFLLFFSLSTIQAQEEVKEDIKEAGKEVKKGAKKVGRKTAELASKGKSKVTDQVHKDKVGPDGETVYIDNHSKYYWVDDRGRRHYITEEELRVRSND